MGSGSKTAKTLSNCLATSQPQFSKVACNWSLFSFKGYKQVLTLPVSRISESCIKIKINLNFYFHTSLWYLKEFYEGLKGLRKTFRGTAKKCENKNLNYFFLFVRDWGGKS